MLQITTDPLMLCFVLERHFILQRLEYFKCFLIFFLQKLNIIEK